MDPQITQAHIDLQAARQDVHDAEAALEQAKKNEKVQSDKLSNLLDKAGQTPTPSNPHGKARGR